MVKAITRVGNSQGLIFDAALLELSSITSSLATLDIQRVVDDNSTLEGLRQRMAAWGISNEAQ